MGGHMLGELAIFIDDETGEDVPHEIVPIEVVDVTAGSVEIRFKTTSNAVAYLRFDPVLLMAIALEIANAE